MRLDKRQKSVAAGRGWNLAGVWTDRMLSALETGVKGGVWFSLIDKVYRRANLESAARKVIARRDAVWDLTISGGLTTTLPNSGCIL